jgi:Mg-chelatase subunit ChlD
VPDWLSLTFVRLWPALLAAAAVVGLVILWRRPRGGQFPLPMLQVSASRSAFRAEALFPTAGIAVLVLLALAMMGPKIASEQRVSQRARDFMILVDTSRSMRHDTAVRRADMETRFQRRAGAFFDAVENPDELPYVARYELARESLFRFLADRSAEDRVALVYFNDDVHPVSALTRNIGLVTEQLADMDDYVNWGTNIAAAMDSSIRMVQRYPGDNRRTMILITDAETRFTEDLESQFQHLAAGGLSFYLLWITAEGQGVSNEDGQAFLDLAEQAGTVVTIRDPNTRNLDDALSDIGRSESYEYETLRRRSIDLAPPLLHAARIGTLIWLCLLVTWMHPAIVREPFHAAAKTPSRIAT